MKVLISALFLSFAFNLYAGEPNYNIRRGSPSQRETIDAAYRRLPNCERRVIDSRLHMVVFVKSSKLQDKEHQLVWADSYGFGMMLLSDDIDGPLLTRIFLHECGHYFDWAYAVSTNERFHDAISNDFKTMSPKKIYKNDYLQNSGEALAEMFAYHFLKQHYFDTPLNYDLQLMQQTHAIFEQSLSTVCGDE